MNKDRVKKELQALGFCENEISTYLDQGMTSAKRLRMLNEQRKAVLTEIHEKEHILMAMDVMRAELRNG